MYYGDREHIELRIKKNGSSDEIKHDSADDQFLKIP